MFFDVPADLLFELGNLCGLLIDDAFENPDRCLQPLDIAFEFAGVRFRAIAEDQNDESNQNQCSTTKAHGPAVGQN